MSALDEARESSEKIDVTPGKIVSFVKDVYARGVEKIENHPQEAAKDAIEMAGAVGVASALAYVARGNSVRVLKSAEAIFSGKLATSIGLESVGNFFGKVDSFARGERAVTFAERSGILKANARSGLHFDFGDKSTFEHLNRNGSEFQDLITSKLNLDSKKLDSGKMAILHPRFKYPEKQLLGKLDERRDLSLWGDKRQGVGVVEYADLNRDSGYFADAKSVVRVTSRSDEAQAEGFARHGASGVFIGRPEQRLVLTNEHVAGGRLLSVETHTGSRFAARVVLSNPERDLAVIQLIDAPPVMHFPVASLSDRPFVPFGEKVAAVGHHGALKGLIASPGHYERYNFDLNVDVVSLDSATQGSSGGPIFDRWGKVISLVAKGIHSTDKVDRALVGGVNLRHIRTFMKQVDAILADSGHSIAEDVSKFESV